MLSEGDLNQFLDFYTWIPNLYILRVLLTMVVKGCAAANRKNRKVTKQQKHVFSLSIYLSHSPILLLQKGGSNKGQKFTLYTALKTQLFQLKSSYTALNVLGIKAGLLQSPKIYYTLELYNLKIYIVQNPENIIPKKYQTYHSQL